MIMASITIRNLDDSVKQTLRERAALHGRSMEEEVRLLISQTVEPGSTLPVSNANTDSGSPLIDEFPGAGKSILLIITGGIAAYKSLDLVRRLRERGVAIRCVMSEAAKHFVSEMAVGAISGGPVYTQLWDRAAEHDIGHIKMAREADLVVVAPATADFMAKIAHGFADDLASTVLLATKATILLAPAMNPQMWAHPATQRNFEILRKNGIHFIGPDSGEMAEGGEAGIGRMAEPLAIVNFIGDLLDDGIKPLAGIRAVVTSGPTHEPVDPVRYIANRSSGKQGHAIAAALARAGAQVTLISGPVTLADPARVNTIHVQTARQMAKAVEKTLPVDLAIMVAAVADWRSADEAAEKMKKQDDSGPPVLKLVENPDILKTIGHHRQRPRLVIGFAAETQHIEENAQAKRKRKNADWIIANDVSPESGVMGGDRNLIRLISAAGTEEWPDLPKHEVAALLVERITVWFTTHTDLA
jgi:phosphopantothenoylcysteine decarboxylase / phosphopantothenate---cysteine ligase